MSYVKKVGGFGWRIDEVRSGEGNLCHIPILLQLWAEVVGINEYTHDMGYRLLTTQLLCTSYCKVGNMSAQGVEIVDHTIEATTGADALLLCRNFIGDAICTIELLPCALNDYVLECRAHP